MVRRLSTTATLCAAALLAVLGLASSASASSTQLTVMQDDGLVLRQDGATRNRTLDEMKALGADVVKVQVYWQEIAPRTRRKPEGFDAASPSAYAFGVYDEIVRAIKARGMRPLLSLGNRAPDWAIGKRTRAHNGTYRPKAAEFGEFAQAIGTRYSGSYAGLPRVDLWSVWNEPNLYSWLAPQRSRRGTPLSPSIYRKLYLAAHGGLRATGHGSDTILMGELMPLGADSKTKVPALDFLRGMACLNRKYRPLRGGSARARGCPSNGRLARMPASGLAYHPYTPRGGPRAKTDRDEASIKDMRRLSRVLDRIGRKGRLPRGLPIWLTEYSFQSNPPDPFLGYSLSRVAGFMDESEWIAFRNRRVRAYSQYTIQDDKLNPGRGARRYAGFQAGLRYANGKAKGKVYEAFRMPAFAHVVDVTRIEIFAGLRAAKAGEAEVQYKPRGKKRARYKRLASVRLNATGYGRAVFRIKNAHKQVYRITIAGHSRVKRAALR